MWTWKLEVEVDGHDADNYSTERIQYDSVILFGFTTQTLTGVGTNYIVEKSCAVYADKFADGTVVAANQPKWDHVITGTITDLDVWGPWIIYRPVAA